MQHRITLPWQRDEPPRRSARSIAPADVAGHRFEDLRVRGRLVLREQASGLHDLAASGETALRHVDLAPGDLDRMVAIRAQALDRHDLLAFGVSHGSHAGAYRLPRDVHGARPQRPAPQPYLLPVSPSWSRRYQSRGMLGSPSNCWLSPFTVKLTMLGCPPRCIGLPPVWAARTCILSSIPGACEHRNRIRTIRKHVGH